MIVNFLQGGKHGCVRTKGNLPNNQGISKTSQ